MDDYMKIKLGALKANIEYLAELMDEEPETLGTYNTLLTAIDYIATIGYVRKRDGEIAPGYAVEKLSQAKVYLTWAIEDFKREEEKE